MLQTVSAVHFWLAALVALFAQVWGELMHGMLHACAQVWDFMSGRLRKDLQYQADEQFMLHDSPVIALAISRDSELLASGSQDGKIKACPLIPFAFHVPLDGACATNNACMCYCCLLLMHE